MVNNLPVTTHGLGVATGPGGLGGTTHRVVGSVSLDTETTGLASGGGDSASFAVLVGGVADPVDAGVVADGNVCGVDADDLVVLEGGILVNPVRVKHTEVHGVATGTLLSDRSQVTVELEVVDTSVHGLSVNNSVGDRSLATTAANSDAVHAESLLGLISELVGLVGTGRARELHDLVSLTVLPGSVG